MTTHTWTPSDRDRLIYRWVKFDGHKQSWVAEQLDLNQSTVSRIVERYERWIAHGGPSQQGALSHAERRRAQRWLTIERNEWLLAACMRLAGEMEHMSDTTKSTTTNYAADPSRDIAVRTENSIRDRTGMVCRYLRLAFRINMEQEKLVNQDDFPALEPFSLDEHEYAQALADAKPKSVDIFPTSDVGRGAPEPDLASLTSNEPLAAVDLAPSLPPSVSPSPAYPSPMPAMHNPEPAQSPLTPSTPTVSLEIAPRKKPTAHAYPVAANPPEPTNQLDPILDATTHQPPPTIRILPLLTPVP